MPALQNAAPWVLVSAHDGTIVDAYLDGYAGAITRSNADGDVVGDQLSDVLGFELDGEANADAPVCAPGPLGMRVTSSLDLERASKTVLITWHKQAAGARERHTAVADAAALRLEHAEIGRLLAVSQQALERAQARLDALQAR